MISYRNQPLSITKSKFNLLCSFSSLFLKFIHSYITLWKEAINCLCCTDYTIIWIQHHIIQHRISQSIVYITSTLSICTIKALTQNILIVKASSIITLVWCGKKWRNEKLKKSPCSLFLGSLSERCWFCEFVIIVSYFICSKRHSSRHSICITLNICKYEKPWHKFPFLYQEFFFVLFIFCKDNIKYYLNERALLIKDMKRISFQMLTIFRFKNMLYAMCDKQLTACQFVIWILLFVYECVWVCSDRRT